MVGCGNDDQGCSPCRDGDRCARKAQAQSITDFGFFRDRNSIACVALIQERCADPLVPPQASQNFSAAAGHGEHLYPRLTDWAL
jgi:hypothetical protein